MTAARLLVPEDHDHAPGRHEPGRELLHLGRERISVTANPAIGPLVLTLKDQPDSFRPGRSGKN